MCFWLCRYICKEDIIDHVQESSTKCDLENTYDWTQALEDAEHALQKAKHDLDTNEPAVKKARQAESQAQKKLDEARQEVDAAGDEAKRLAKRLRASQ